MELCSLLWLYSKWTDSEWVGYFPLFPSLSHNIYCACVRACACVRVYVHGVHIIIVCTVHCVERIESTVCSVCIVCTVCKYNKI